MKYHIDDLYIDDTPNAVLYRRTMEHYPKSIIGCFIISDNWYEQALLELKQRSGAYFILGLQKNDNEVERLQTVEGLIKCQPD